MTLVTSDDKIQEFTYPSQLVSDKYVQSQDLVADTRLEVENYSNNLATFLGELEIPVDYYQDLEVQMPNPAAFDIELPDPGNVVWPEDVLYPEVPVMRPLMELTDILILDPPVSTINDPGYDPPSKPVAGDIQEPGTVPELRDVEIPESLTFTMPDEITLTQITVDDTPEYSVPTFNASLADREAIPLPQEMLWEESAYNSSIWNDLLDKVLAGVRDGGTGLDEAVEDLIYSSARYRQEIEDLARWEEVRARYTGKGFDLHTGTQVALEKQATDEIDRNKTELNAKIAIDQAQLAQTNTHFMLDKAVSLEQILVGFYDSQAARAIEGAKAVADSGFKLFDARVAKQKANIEHHQAQLDSLRGEMEIGLADLNAFKISVEGKKVSAEAQQAIVQMYSAQVGALESKAKMYTAQVEGAKAVAEIEKLKMENFKIETEAFVARISGEEARYSLYATEVEAEKTKIMAFAERWKAHATEVESIKASNEARIQKQQAVLANNTAIIEEHKANIGAFIAQNQVISSKFETSARVLDSKTSQYTAKASVVESRNNQSIKILDANIQVQKLNLDQQIARVNSHTDGYVALRGLEKDVRVGVLNTSAQVMSASLTSVSANASMGSSYSSSNSSSFSASRSDGYSEIHSYSESV